MNRSKIKKLANVTFVNGAVDKSVAKFVLTRLSKNDLKIYLRYLKEHINKNRVYISFASNPDKKMLEAVAKIFVRKDLVISVDEGLGAGIVIKDQDNIYDLSFKGTINKTVEELKSEL